VVLDPRRGWSPRRFRSFEVCAVAIRDEPDREIRAERLELFDDVGGDFGEGP